jgi:LPS export ABC transporter protein LptC
MILISCSSPVNQTQQEVGEIVDKPDQMSWNVDITISHSGKLRANIKSDYLEQYAEKSTISLENNVKIDFYNNEEELISNLFADKASINERVNFLQATDNVIVQSDSGVTLFTDTLTWDNEQEIIFTEDSVMITTTSNDTLYGIGFQSDVNMEQWKILKPRGVTSR